MTSELDFTLARKEDSVGLFLFWTDYSVTKFTLLRNIKTIEDCENIILRHIDNIANNGGLGPFCVKKENVIIGYCGGTTVEGKVGEYEIFYNIGKEYWGSGFGTVIATYLLNQLFSETKAKKVIAFAVADNIASWKLLENVGMNRTETLIDDFENTQGKYDLYKYEKAKEIAL